MWIRRNNNIRRWCGILLSAISQWYFKKGESSIWVRILLLAWKGIFVLVRVIYLIISICLIRHCLICRIIHQLHTILATVPLSKKNNRPLFQHCDGVGRIDFLTRRTKKWARSSYSVRYDTLPSRSIVQFVWLFVDI